MTAGHVAGATRRPDDAPDLSDVIQWLHDEQPEDLTGCLIHNDFKYDNVVYAPTDFSTILAVLDWELCTVGDPLMDLGTSLAYWIEPEDDPVLQSVAGPTARAGNMRRLEVAQRYADRSGRTIDNLLFYYVCGLFKVAVIGQQIYYRYRQGLTSDPRFAGLTFLVNAAGQRAREALDNGSVS